MKHIFLTENCKLGGKMIIALWSTSQKKFKKTQLLFWSSKKNWLQRCKFQLFESVTVLFLFIILPIIWLLSTMCSNQLHSHHVNRSLELLMRLKVTCPDASLSFKSLVSVYAVLSAFLPSHNVSLVSNCINSHEFTGDAKLSKEDTISPARHLKWTRNFQATSTRVSEVIEYYIGFAFNKRLELVPKLSKRAVTVLVCHI